MKPSVHVLLVEDDAAIRDLEQVRLRRLGCKVTVQSSAPAALEAVNADPNGYDLILTDYNMPQINGLELVSELRQQGCGVPAILMTGYSSTVSEETALSAGLNAFLRKPFGGEQLQKLLDDLLDLPQGRG